MVILMILFVVGWVAAALLGTQAYFRGEQTKPIHERNWRSNSFETLSTAITGSEIDYAERTYAYASMDAFNSTLLPEA